MKRLSKAEKETIIRFTEADDKVSITTHNLPLKRRLLAFCEKYPTLCLHVSQKKSLLAADHFLLDKSCFSVRFIHPYTDEQRQEARERAKKQGLGKGGGKE